MRITTVDHTGYLWMAGKSRTTSFEVVIPVETAKKMMKEYGARFLYKTRYHIIHQDRLWLIDAYEKNNEGIFTAETSLSSEEEYYAKPQWLIRNIEKLGRFSEIDLLNYPNSIRNGKENRFPDNPIDAFPWETISKHSFADQVLDHLFYTGKPKGIESKPLREIFNPTLSEPFKEEVTSEDRSFENTMSNPEHPVAVFTPRTIRGKVWKWILKILDTH